MRKAQKEQAENFIANIVCAHKCIFMTKNRQHTEFILEVLEDCQSGAMILGKMIEESEGERFPTIALLEKYCELIYTVYENLLNEHQGQIIHGCMNAVNSELYIILGQIESSVRNEIKVKKEAVFLPYKASMWDSLESVWMALDQNENYDAYVVPVPYYDKNPDGSFREFHYEISGYPENVPVVDYRSYDIEKRRPDEVYIHSPYDEFNYVTSVEPFYYSKNLKKYTDKLVYIPYFILEEPDPEDTAVLEAMEHFVTVPAVIHADQVIVQSEAMRDAYVKIMTKYMEGKGMTQEYWEQKILGTGSPKFDGLASLRQKDLKIPEQWKRVVCKPDGTFKKIVLYNTTVTGLLEHSDRYIAKMRDVFRIFEKNKENVALLWRPHPLIQATISSMRPQLWGEFLKVKNEYLEAGWGIYDDSAELSRAIGVSDAYYGDGSSVVQLCQRVKVPVMIQNCKIISRSGAE